MKRNLPLKARKLEDDLGTLGGKLLNAEVELNTDRILAESLEESKNIVLAMHFSIGNPIGKPDTSLPGYVKKNILKDITNNPIANPDNIFPLPAFDTLFPIESVGIKADSIGGLIAYPDSDGGIRSEPLVINFYDEFYPSQSLIIAARSLNLGPDNIKVKLGEGVQLGKLSIKTDPYLQMNTFFYSSDDESSAFQVDSFYDVLQGKIPANKYRGKIVLIGATATGVGDSMVTPINANMAPVLTLAHSVSSILNEDFFIEPEWTYQARLGVLAFLVLYIMFVLPRLNAGVSSFLTLALLGGMFAAHYVLMTEHGQWFQLMTPAILLVIGHTLLTTKRYLMTEKGKLQLDAESAESNRMLGLSLQGQGQLDAAFDKFRKLAPNKESLELLYNLALDF